MTTPTYAEFLKRHYQLFGGSGITKVLETEPPSTTTFNAIMKQRRAETPDSSGETPDKRDATPDNAQGLLRHDHSPELCNRALTASCRQSEGLVVRDDGCNGGVRNPDVSVPCSGFAKVNRGRSPVGVDKVSMRDLRKQTSHSIRSQSDVVPTVANAVALIPAVHRAKSH